MCESPSVRVCVSRYTWLAEIRTCTHICLCLGGVISMFKRDTNVYFWDAHVFVTDVLEIHVPVSHMT